MTEQTIELAQLGLAAEHPVPHGTAAPTFHAGRMCGGDVRKLDARSRGLVWTFDAWRIAGRWIARTSTLADPLPSHHVDTTLVEMFGGDNPNAYVRRQKIGALAQHLILHELLTGNLVASFLEGAQKQPIPPWAWVNPHRTKYAWSEGRLPLDVRLPDEWQRWNCCECALDRKQFGHWVREELPSLMTRTVEIPDLAQIEQEMPALIKAHLPSDRPWIELSEALTWIAFDFSVSKGRLYHAIDAGELGLSSQVVEVELSEALIRLADLAAGGNIGLRGKWTDDDTFEGKLTEAIPQQHFHDFRRYDILRDGLGFGNGYNPHEPLAFLDTSRGQYFDVTVNRAEFLNAFPFQPNAQSPDGYAYRAGLPGRPSIMDAVLQEFERRWKANEYAGSQNTEADALEEWVRLNHPNAPQKPKAKTIRNKIGPLVRAKTCPKQ